MKYKNTVSTSRGELDWYLKNIKGNWTSNIDQAQQCDLMMVEHVKLEDKGETVTVISGDEGYEVVSEFPLTFGDIKQVNKATGWE